MIVVDTDCTRGKQLCRVLKEALADVHCAHDPASADSAPCEAFLILVHSYDDRKVGLKSRGTFQQRYTGGETLEEGWIPRPIQPGDVPPLETIREMFDALKEDREPELFKPVRIPEHLLRLAVRCQVYLCVHADPDQSDQSLIQVDPELSKALNQIGWFSLLDGKDVRRLLPDCFEPANRAKRSRESELPSWWAPLKLASTRTLCKQEWGVRAPEAWNSVDAFLSYIQETERVELKYVLNAVLALTDRLSHV